MLTLSALVETGLKVLVVARFLPVTIHPDKACIARVHFEWLFEHLEVQRLGATAGDGNGLINELIILAMPGSRPYPGHLPGTPLNRRRESEQTGA